VKVKPRLSAFRKKVNGEMRFPHRRARVGGLCGFRGTAEARANRKQKNRTLRQCAGALRKWQTQKKEG